MRHTYAMRRFRRSGASLRELEAAYRSGFQRYVSVATAIVRDAEAGRDVVQDAFATAVRTRGSFRREGPLEAWLWRIVITAAATERRRRRDVPTGGVSTEGSTNGDGESADVADAIALLPERQRLVVFLRYYADLDYESIGELLGIAVGTVGATLHAAQRSIRRQLEEVRV